MDLQLFSNATSLSGWKGFIESSEFVSVEIIHDNDQLFSIWKMNIDQLTHTMCPVNHGATLSDLDMSPPGQGCKKDEHIGRARAPIFEVITRQLPRLGR